MISQIFWTFKGIKKFLLSGFVLCRGFEIHQGVLNSLLLILWSAFSG